MPKKRRDKEAVSMKEAVDRYLKAMGIDKKVHETRVLSKWEDIVGEAVKKRTTKLFVRENTLYVEVSSSVIRDELQQAKSVIIDRFNEVAGFKMIEDIYLK